VLNYLDRINEEEKLPIRRLTRNDDGSDDDTTWTYRGPIGRLDFQEVDVINDISIRRLRTMSHYRHDLL